MDAMDILEALGPIRDMYILSAGEVRRKKKPRRMPYALAAILALAILCTVLLQTPVGVAAVEAVKEAVTNVIERLFPPKDVIVNLEGNPTAIAHEAQGQEPQEEVPGFAIYVDTSGYEMIEEAGSTYIRPLIFDASLPKCEMEITHIPGKSAQSTARDHREEVSALWDYVGELQWTDRPLAWVFPLWQDGGWDAQREDHYFADDGQGGTYHITSRYFLEAAEGHGIRFAYMIQTFRVVSSEDAEAASTEDTPAQILEAASSAEETLAAFVTAYFAGDIDSMKAYLTADFSSPVEGYPYDTTPVLHAFKNLDDPARDMEAQGFLTPSVEFWESADSDSYTYLSIVMKWEDGQWKIDSYGLEG